MQIVMEKDAVKNEHKTDDGYCFFFIIIAQGMLDQLSNNEMSERIWFFLETNKRKRQTYKVDRDVLHLYVFCSVDISQLMHELRVSDATMFSVYGNATVLSDVKMQCD